ncbi:MAG: hypothetical protein LBR36_04325 [Bacteroidales bacterium]|nr:hypothetical protein [Bacteroidales bacterium]
MKKILVSTLIFCGICSAYSQNISLDKKDYDKMIQETDSIKKELVQASKTYQSSIIQKDDTIKLLRKEADEKKKDFDKQLQTKSDSIKRLHKELDGLKESKSKKKEFDKQLQTKSDSINLLKTQLSDEKQKGRRSANEERERGKSEALSSVVSTYKNSRFDNLIRSSSKESVQRDKQLVGDNPEIKTTLDDLYKYFNAKELLSKKYDESRVRDAQKQLEQVKQKSENIDKLKETLGNFQTFNEGMKETVKKIVDLDNRETVEGMSDEIRQKKFNKILAEISAYIFNYDFNFSDYPYLSDILLEIFKRKQPDADANISDLLQKL